MEGNKITKIDFITKSGDKILIDSLIINQFFEFLKDISIRNMITFSWKRFDKIRICKFLLPTCFKKLIKIKSSALESMWLTLLSPIKNLKEIVKIEVYIKDKILYFNSKKIKLSELMWNIGQVIHHNQYSVDEQNIKDKIVIDAGANQGVFSLFAVLMGAKRVYAFEPVSSTTDVLLENIRLNNIQDKITIIGKALGGKNYSSEISFGFVGDGTAKIGPKSLSRKSEKIEIIKLDDFISNNKLKKIDFIKIDTEGCEENVLIGASKTIAKFKPVLSLSAYHRLNDKKRLPMVIKSLRKDYKIILNHFDEETFYCS